MNDMVKVVGELVHWPLLFFLAISSLLISCDSELSEEAKKTIYQGPLRTLENAEIFHSDSGRLKAKILAKKVLNLQNEDREAPDGLFITFYDKDGSESATLRADYAFYTNEKKIWQARGDVIIHNIKNNETLKTEELFWDPKAEEISTTTETFVKIELEDGFQTGTELVAKQDFSEWTLKPLGGEIEFEDEE